MQTRMSARFRWEGKVLLLFLLLLPWRIDSQELDREAEEAFFMTLARHFQVSSREVRVIAEWELTYDEVPVVLYMARRGGVSPDALAGFRRGGRSWWEVAALFGMGPRTFHLDLPRDADLGFLEESYEEFRSLPVSEWGRVRLEDREIVALVNMKILSEALEVPPLEVLHHRREVGSFAECYPLRPGS